MRDTWQDQSVLLTGGSGTLGTALALSYLDRPPKRLVIYSRGWQAQNELAAKLGRVSWVRFFIGDVLDALRLRRALDGIDVVIHAAAMKEIHAVEYNPRPAIHNNVLGTENVINESIDADVDKLLVISTDKAVAAKNLYGKTKALAESLAVASNAYTTNKRTKISVARYGNVFGSSGSVLEVWLKQLIQGKKLTVTDSRATRFFLTKEKAVSFIDECLGDMAGGEIFVAKAGSAKMVELARLIAGGDVAADIGLRPGEKLHEVLITEDEGQRTIDHGTKYVILPEYSFEGRVADSCMVRGFEYASDTNTDTLTTDDLATMLKGVGDDSLHAPDYHRSGCDCCHAST